jgi:ribosomal-protein-alanine N-acetyltransferase
MFLEVSDTNHPARALYQRFGFQRVGLRRGYYPGGGNALVLRRDLSPVAATAL